MGKAKQVLIAALVGGLIGALAVRFARHPKLDIGWTLAASMAGWVLFSVYWSVAATNAPAESTESRGSRRIHEVLMNAGYLLLLLPAAVPFKIPVVQQRFLPDSALFAAAGLTVQACSFALAVWARRILGRNWSGRIEIKTDHQLVRSGPYRMLRHPIYSAVFGMVIGTALTIGRLHALLAIAVIAIAYWRKIRMEEAKLRDAFGAEYEDYRRTTWRLIPGLL